MLSTFQCSQLAGSASRRRHLCATWRDCCACLSRWMVIPLAYEDQSSARNPMHLFFAIFFSAVAVVAHSLPVGKAPHCRHGRGGVCALIRSPLIGSVSHQGGVGHYTDRSTVRRGRTGGQFAGLSPREERGAAPSPPNILYLYLNLSCKEGKRKLQPLACCLVEAHSNAKKAPLGST